MPYSYRANIYKCLSTNVFIYFRTSKYHWRQILMHRVSGRPAARASSFAGEAKKYYFCVRLGLCLLTKTI